MKAISKTAALALAASLAASGAARAVPVQWEASDGGNGHWYELVTGSFTWSQARSAALGMTHLGMGGYLATVMTEAEHLFITSEVNPSPLYAWLGGTDAAVEGEWRWADGPEAGQLFWSGGPGGTAYSFEDWNSIEPNDTGGNEDYLGGWASGTGLWNDVSGATSIGAFIVEYGPAAAVPLPAAAPMLVAGLGGFVLLRRRRAAG